MMPKSMTRFNIQIRRLLLTAGVITLCVLSSAAIALSAPIGIDYLSVDQVNLSATTSLPIAPFVTDLTYSPPRVITMGQYSPSPPSTSSDIYFTGAYGAPPPSGTVDGDVSAINVDFSSLWAHVYYNAGFASVNDDVPLWDDSIEIITNYYNPDDNSFTLEWSGNTPVNVVAGPSSAPYPVNYNITVSGTVSTVPIPGAVWLFASGLLGLAGCRKRYKI